MSTHNISNLGATGPVVAAYKGVLERTNALRTNHLNTLECLSQAAALIRLNIRAEQAPSTDNDTYYRDLAQTHQEAITSVKQFLSQIGAAITNLQGIESSNGEQYTPTEGASPKSLYTFCQDKLPGLHMDQRFFQALLKELNDHITNPHGFAQSWEAWTKSHTTPNATHQLPTKVPGDASESFPEVNTYNKLVESADAHKEKALQLLQVIARATTIMRLWHSVVLGQDSTPQEIEAAQLQLSQYETIKNQVAEHKNTYDQLDGRLVRCIDDFSKIQPKDPVFNHTQNLHPYLIRLRTFHSNLQHRFDVHMKLHTPSFVTTYEQLQSRLTQLRQTQEATAPPSTWWMSATQWFGLNAQPKTDPHSHVHPDGVTILDENGSEHSTSPEMRDSNLQEVEKYFDRVSITSDQSLSSDTTEQHDLNFQKVEKDFVRASITSDQSLPSDTPEQQTPSSIRQQEVGFLRSLPPLSAEQLSVIAPLFEKLLTPTKRTIALDKRWASFLRRCNDKTIDKRSGEECASGVLLQIRLQLLAKLVKDAARKASTDTITTRLRDKLSTPGSIKSDLYEDLCRITATTQTNVIGPNLDVEGISAETLIGYAVQVIQDLDTIKDLSQLSIEEDPHLMTFSQQVSTLLHFLNV
jgi:hypothetical protein